MSKVIHPLVPSDHPMISTKLEEFDFENPPADPVELSECLKDCLDHYKGIGLSANQLGLPYRVFNMKIDGEYITCFNPKIILNSHEQVVIEEGCLTFPNLYVKIRRPEWVKVRFTDEYGETRTETYNGITARVFLHEVDHLDGIVFLKRASNLAITRAKKQKKLIERKKKRLKQTKLKRESE